MSEEEILDLYKELEDFYGEGLANHVHHPIQFKHQLKVFNYIKSKETGTDLEVQNEETS